jgi:hypothetical protein
MNLDYSDWNQDLPSEGKEEYQTLINHLNYKEKNKFGLFFVECMPLEEDKIITDIIHDLPNKKIEVLRLFEPVHNLYDQVFDLYSRKKFDILLIKGLEHSFYEYEQLNFGEITEDKSINLTKVPLILNHLNQKREMFRDNIPISFVFILHQFSIDYFVRRAPDFLDWCSTVVQISTTSEVLEEKSFRKIVKVNY